MRAKNSLYTENRYQHTVYEENNVENEENCLPVLSSSSGHSSRWMSPPSSTLILLVSMMTVVVSHISLSPLFLPSSERKEYDHNNSHAKFIILHLELKQCYTQEYLTELCFFNLHQLRTNTKLFPLASCSHSCCFKNCNYPVCKRQ